MKQTTDRQEKLNLIKDVATGRKTLEEVRPLDLDKITDQELVTLLSIAEKNGNKITNEYEDYYKELKEKYR